MLTNVGTVMQELAQEDAMFQSKRRQKADEKAAAQKQDH